MRTHHPNQRPSIGDQHVGRLHGSAPFSTSLPCWGRHSTCSLGHEAFRVATAGFPCRPRGCDVTTPPIRRTAKKGGEPVGPTDFLPRAPIMKVAARHEAESKIGRTGVLFGAALPLAPPGPCPRGSLGVAALAEMTEPMTAPSEESAGTSGGGTVVRMRRTPGGRQGRLNLRLTNEEERQIRHRAEGCGLSAPRYLIEAGLSRFSE